MGIKEKVEQIRNEELTNEVGRKQREDLESQRVREEAIAKSAVNEERLRKAVTDWKIPAILNELNEECLGEKGALRYDYDDHWHTPTLEVFLEWDSEEGEKDSYVKAQASFGKTRGLFSREVLTLYISHAGDINAFDRNSLEDAFAKAFIHPESHVSDGRAAHERYQLDQSR